MKDAYKNSVPAAAYRENDLTQTMSASHASLYLSNGKQVDVDRLNSQYYSTNSSTSTVCTSPSEVLPKYQGGCFKKEESLQSKNTSTVIRNDKEVTEKLEKSLLIDVKHLPKDVLTKARQLFGREICQNYLQEHGFKRAQKEQNGSMCFCEENNNSMFLKDFESVSFSYKKKEGDDIGGEENCFSRLESASDLTSQTERSEKEMYSSTDETCDLRDTNNVIECKSLTETQAMVDLMVTDDVRNCKSLSESQAKEDLMIMDHVRNCKSLSETQPKADQMIMDHVRNCKYLSETQAKEDIMIMDDVLNCKSLSETQPKEDLMTMDDVPNCKSLTETQAKEGLRAMDDVFGCQSFLETRELKMLGDKMTLDEPKPNLDVSKSPANGTTLGNEDAITVAGHGNETTHRSNNLKTEVTYTEKSEASVLCTNTTIGNSKEVPVSCEVHVVYKEQCSDRYNQHDVLSAFSSFQTNADKSKIGVEATTCETERADQSTCPNFYQKLCTVRENLIENVKENESKPTLHPSKFLNKEKSSVQNTSENNYVNSHLHYDPFPNKNYFTNERHQSNDFPLNEENQHLLDLFSVDVKQGVSVDNEFESMFHKEKIFANIVENNPEEQATDSLGAYIKTRNRREKQIDGSYNNKQNQEMYSEISNKKRKVSALSVYASIENGVIAEVTCKRYKKRTTRFRESGETFETIPVEDCKTAAAEDESNSHRKSGLVVSPKPTDYNCKNITSDAEPVVRDVVKELVHTVFLNSLDLKDDLSFVNPNDVRVKDLFQKFCDEFNFEHGDFQDFYSDFSETVKPQISGCGEYSVPPTKRKGRRKSSQSVNLSEAECSKKISHNEESVTRSKFYHSIRLRKKSKWLRQVPVGKRVVTRLTLHEMGLEKVEDLENIREPKKFKYDSEAIDNYLDSKKQFLNSSGLNKETSNSFKKNQTFFFKNVNQRKTGNNCESCKLSCESVDSGEQNGLYGNLRDQTDVQNSNILQDLKQKAFDDQTLMNHNSHKHDRTVRDVQTQELLNPFPMESNSKCFAEDQTSSKERKSSYSESFDSDSKKIQEASYQSRDPKPKQDLLTSDHTLDQRPKKTSMTSHCSLDPRPREAVITPHQSLESKPTKSLTTYYQLPNDKYKNVHLGFKGKYCRENVSQEICFPTSLQEIGEDSIKRARLDLSKKYEHMHLSTFISSLPIASLPPKYRRLHSFDTFDETDINSPEYKGDCPLDLTIPPRNEKETGSATKPGALVQRVRPQVQRLSESSNAPVRQPPKRAFQIKNSQKQFTLLESGHQESRTLRSDDLSIKKEPTSALLQNEASKMVNGDSCIIQDVTKEESILRTLLLEDGENGFDNSLYESDNKEPEEDKYCNEPSMEPVNKLRLVKDIKFHSIEKLLPETNEQNLSPLTEEKETPIRLEENPIFVENGDWKESSVWAKDTQAVKDKIEKLRKEILYLDMMAAQKEKERLLIIHFKKYKKEVMKKIFKQRILPSKRTETKPQSDLKTNDENCAVLNQESEICLPISAQSQPSDISHCLTRTDSNSVKSRKETCLVRPLQHVENNCDSLQKDSLTNAEFQILKSTGVKTDRDLENERLTKKLVRKGNGQTKVEDLSSSAETVIPGTNHQMFSPRTNMKLSDFSVASLSTSHVPQCSSASSPFTSMAHSKHEKIKFAPVFNTPSVTPVTDLNNVIPIENGSYFTTPKSFTSTSCIATQQGALHLGRAECLPHFSEKPSPSVSTYQPISPIHRLPATTYTPFNLTSNSPTAMIPSWIPMGYPWWGTLPPTEYQTSNQRSGVTTESSEDGIKKAWK